MPGRPHAVCVSLPKFEDLIGYEEKHPATLASMPTGYPRFVRHAYIQRMVDDLLTTESPGRQGYLFARSQDCQEVIGRFNPPNISLQQGSGWHLLSLDDQAPENQAISSYFQHTGCGISSRLAETYLFEKGLLEEHESICGHEEPELLIKETIARAHGPEVGSEDLLLASSGANAFHALFQTAVQEANRQRKSIWIRWGWLYLDTIEVINLYTAEDGRVIELHQVGDLASLEEVFREHGADIAGIVTEFPTNPLLQSGDLEKARALCEDADALLVIDPTMASPKNAQVTHMADVVVNSLTKYAGWEGDVMMGSLAFPRSSERGRKLFDQTKAKISPPYSRDLLRLAEQIPFYDNFVEQANGQAMRVAEFLQRHPKIKHLHWAYQDGLGKNYQKFAGTDKPGCNLSFEITGNFEEFYNRLPMLKSPSFGTEFSNCCPYVYLAHYSFIQSKEGMARLQGAGLSPHLYRLSVGLEPVEKIIETLDSALK